MHTNLFVEAHPPSLNIAAPTSIPIKGVIKAAQNGVSTLCSWLFQLTVLPSGPVTPNNDAAHEHEDARVEADVYKYRNRSST